MKMPFSECRSEGEKRIYNFFKDSLSDEFIVWSNVELAIFSDNINTSTEIDFIIFHKDIGLNILSVKDWRIDQISRIDFKEITVNNRVTNNPYLNLKNQFYSLKQRLEQKLELKDSLRRLMAPINFSLGFPYILKEDWVNKIKNEEISCIEDCIPEKIILFNNMFGENSLLNNKDRAISFFQNIRADTGKFPCSFENRHIEILDLIFGARKDIKEKPDPPVIDIKDDDFLLELDKHQIEIAQQYLKNMYNNPGPKIIKGLAGSGKTILLLHIFSQLSRDPNLKLLYIGRQNELVQDFKRKLNNIDVVIESPNYTIDTFHKFFKDKCPYYDYRMLITGKSKFPEDKAINKYISKNSKKFNEVFDFTFIDEGHNLSDEMIKFLVLHTKGKEKGNIIYVEDFEQNIYRVKRNKKKSGLELAEEKTLLVNYRNTYEISDFAFRLCDKYKDTQVARNLKNLRHGAMPKIYLTNGKNLEIINKVFEDCKDWEEDGFLKNEIAVIYPNFDKAKDKLFLEFIDKFTDSNITFSHHYRQDSINQIFGYKYQDKIISRFKNIEEIDAINIITSFSSQGLSFKCSIVFMDNFEDKKWKYFKRNLAYISLTRATHNLILIFSKKNATYNKAIEIVEELERIRK